MARTTDKLTDAKVKALLKAAQPGIVNDGGGLYLRVGSSGGASWILKYHRDRRAREMGLGSYPAVTLAMARQKASDLRQQVAAGSDPIATKREAKAEAERAATTLEQVAAQYIKSHESSWTNATHRRQWRQTLRDFVLPVIGTKPIDAIGIADVEAVLAPIWHEKPVTAGRVRARLETLLDFAAAKGLRPWENPAALRRVQHLYPKKAAIHKVQHHPAMPHAEVAAFLARLKESSSIGALAVRFAVLTATRSLETRGAVWSEIDLAARLWTIPAERMKMDRAHTVPLSDGAMQVLREAEQHRRPGSDLVFPGRGKREIKPLFDIASFVPHGFTLHGFRSSFRDFCSECTNVSREVAEMCLAHAVGDATEAAYARSDLLEKRRALMQQWCTYITGSAEDVAA